MRHIIIIVGTDRWTDHPLALAHSTRAANATLFPVPAGPRISSLAGADGCAEEEDPPWSKSRLNECMLLRCIMAGMRDAATSSCQMGWRYCIVGNAIIVKDQATCQVWVTWKCHVLT